MMNGISRFFLVDVDAGTIDEYDTTDSAVDRTDFDRAQPGGPTRVMRGISACRSVPDDVFQASALFAAEDPMSYGPVMVIAFDYIVVRAMIDEGTIIDGYHDLGRALRKVRHGWWGLLLHRASLQARKVSS